jgi:hypothetical protein
MSYTLWSHGVLMGESDLELEAPPPTRIGPFRPAASGRSLLALFEEAMVAVREIGPMLQRHGISAERRGAETGKAIYNALKETPEGRRVRATSDAIDALELELRGADGRVVPTQQITLQDSWALAPEISLLPPEATAEMEMDGFPRYLLAVIFAPSETKPD